ncbi:MAG: hypothetical protein K0S81_2683 [Rhodospirillales bacterium]|jgi:uncharacterized RmlC-like cupin family protein|nr:hypothetical protein [Rhodospirillales bacterium]
MERSQRVLSIIRAAGCASLLIIPGKVGADADAEIVTVRPDAAVMTKQRLPNYVGISKATAGASAISMNLVVIPPGGKAEPHSHKGFETAIYVLEGEVETRYGRGLAKSIINKAGDFIFIPADVPHQPVNLRADKPARAIVARNHADEQESVIPYDPAKAH